MAGSKKTTHPHWQKIVKNSLLDIVKHPDFNEDFETLFLSQRDHDLFSFNLRRMMQKYSLPKGSVGFLLSGIRGGNFNISDAPPPIFLIDEASNEVLPDDKPKQLKIAYDLGLKERRNGRVLLDLTADTQRQDIDDFLDLYFDSLIKPRLKKLDVSRPGARKKLLRDKDYYRVIGLYKEKLADPTSKRSVYREIEIETKLKPTDIKKFIAKYRAQTKHNLVPPENWEEYQANITLG